MSRALERSVKRNLADSRPMLKRALKREKATLSLGTEENTP